MDVSAYTCCDYSKTMLINEVSGDALYETYHWHIATIEHEVWDVIKPILMDYEMIESPLLAFSSFNYTPVKSNGIFLNIKTDIYTLSID